MAKVSMRSIRIPKNAIFTIFPYCKRGVWMFDDTSVGVKEEPFVSGADTLIEKLVAAFAVKDPKKGFVLQFSDKPFPSSQVKLDRKGDGGPETGTWYTMSSPTFGKPMEGWLCAVLNSYYPRSPKSLYVSVRSTRR